MRPPDEPGAVDPADLAPLSSQVVGHYGSPLATVDAAEPILAEEISPIAGRRFRTLGRLFHSRKFVVGLVLFAVIALLAIFAPLAARYNPDLPNYSALNQNPNPTHWLGTDYLGRDLWSRLIWGGRVSLPAGFLIVAVSFCIGVPWGIAAGYGGKLIDDVLMRLIDVLLAFPGLVLAFSIVAILGSGTRSVVIALGVAGIPGYARVARASTLRVRELDYVLASQAQGAGPAYIMRTHILRNIVDALVILATLNLSGAILAAAALSFLGIGTQLPASDWGTMLSSGFNYMFESWSQVTFPALIIVICVLGINLMGDSLGEALDPRLGSGR